MKAIVLDNQCDKIASFDTLQDAKKFRAKMQRTWKQWFGVLYGSGERNVTLHLSRSRQYNTKGKKYLKP